MPGVIIFESDWTLRLTPFLLLLLNGINQY